MARYLLQGHLTKDLLPNGGFRFGGAVLYSGLTVRRLGFETHVLSASAEPIETLERLFPELFIHQQTVSTTTIFENLETPSGRRQKVYAMAPPLDLSILLPELFHTEILHLAPVLNEIPPERDFYKPFQTAYLVANPQGWFRKVSAEGLVTHIRPDLSRAPRFKALVVSEEDLSADPEGLLDDLRELSEILVVTCGAKGARLWAAGRESFIPSPQVKVVDTTGAGDILAGAFFGLLYRGSSPEKALEKAVRMAAIGVSRPGLSGVPTFEEIRDLLEKTDKV